MTDIFTARVDAFDANLSFQALYAEEIRRFMRDILARVSQGAALLPEQRALLYTDDLGAFTRVLTEWADTLEASAPRLKKLLASGQIFQAVQSAISWPSNQSRLCEAVLDIYRFEGNRLLQNPYEASAAARAELEAVFPINVKAKDPLEGRPDEFANQLMRFGNPWI